MMGIPAAKSRSGQTRRNELSERKTSWRLAAEHPDTIEGFVSQRFFNDDRETLADQVPEIPSRPTTAIIRLRQQSREFGRVTRQFLSERRKLPTEARFCGNLCADKPGLRHRSSKRPYPF